MDKDEWMSGARWVGGSRDSKHLVGAYLESTRNQSKLKRRRVSRLSAPQGADWICPQHVPHTCCHCGPKPAKSGSVQENQKSHVFSGLLTKKSAPKICGAEFDGQVRGAQRRAGERRFFSPRLARSEGLAPTPPIGRSRDVVDRFERSQRLAGPGQPPAEAGPLWAAARAC